jgi:hypothetical protein
LSLAAQLPERMRGMQWNCDIRLTTVRTRSSFIAIGEWLVGATGWKVRLLKRKFLPKFAAEKFLLPTNLPTHWIGSDAWRLDRIGL